MLHPELTAETLARDGLTEGFFTVEEEFYHGQIKALSQSRLKEYAKSPAHFKASMENTDDDTYNPVFAEGKAWHVALLEPHRFAEACVIEPRFDRRTKAGKQQYDEWHETSKGKIAIPEDTCATIVRTVEMMREDNMLTPFLTGGIAEIACVAKHPKFEGLWCKAKLDYWHPQTNFILDLKTTHSIEDFMYSMHKYDYLLQAAFYTDLVQHLTGETVAGYGILAVEKKKPNAYKIFMPTDMAIDYGRRRYHKFMSKHLECLRNDKWPVYDTLIESFEAKSWYVNNL